MFTHCKSGLLRKSSAFIAGERFASSSERTTWYSRFAIAPSVTTPVAASTRFSQLKRAYLSAVRNALKGEERFWGASSSETGTTKWKARPQNTALCNFEKKSKAKKKQKNQKKSKNSTN
jgi:hypothetical protein